MLISFLNYVLSVDLNIANDANVCRHLLAFVLGAMQAMLQIKCQLEDAKLIAFHLLENNGQLLIPNYISIKAQK